MRVLLASTGGAGHFGPLVPFVDALARRGDEVLIAVPPELEPTVASMGHAFVLTSAPPAGEVEALWERFAKVSRSEAAVLANRDYFGRLCTSAMLPVVERACRDWAPDLVLHEAAEFASAVAAERCGIRHAQVGVSLAEVEAGSLDLAAPVLRTFHEPIVERLRASPYVTRMPASLDPSPYPATRRFREVVAEPPRGLPDWWQGSEAPLVYVTFGSVAGEFAVTLDTYRTALQAVAELDARVLLTLGRAADLEAIGPLPANAHAEAWVPQAEVLSSAAAVVAHGGSGTTFGALAAGVPLVLVPLFSDQPVNSERVAETGAALVVAPRRGAAQGIVTLTAEDAPRLRAAIEAVLGEPSYRRAAGRIAAEMRAYPSIDELVEALAVGSPV